MRLSATVKVAVLALLLPLQAAQAQGRAGGLTEEEQTFEAAENAFKEGRDDDALKLYARVSNMNPSRADAYTKRAVIHYKRRQYAEAVTVLTRGRELLPDDPSLAGQLGLTLYRMNQVDKAVGLLEQAVARLPGAYQYQLQLGQHYVKVGDGKRAVAALEAYFKGRSESTSASDVQIRALSGAAYYLNRQYAEAERDLEAVLRADPKDIPTRVTLGSVYTARGEWSRAVALYEPLGSVEAGRQPVIRQNLAICYQKLHRLAEAEREAVSYATMRPQDARAFVVLGDIRADRKDRSGAIGAWGRAHSIDPNVETGGREGRLLLLERRYAEALTVLEEARRGRPLPEVELDVLTGLADAYAATQQAKDKVLPLAAELSRRAEPEAQLGAGVAYYAAGDDAKAVPAFTAALASARTRARARSGLRLSLNRRAGAELQAGNVAAAHKSLEAARDADPNSVVTSRNLGLVLLLEGRYAEAEKALQVAHKRVENDAAVTRLLGRAALGQGRRDEALRMLESAAQAAQKVRGPALAEIEAELGPLYAEQQKYDQAVAALDTAIKESPDGALHDVATRNLAVVLLKRGIARLSDRENRDNEGGADDLARAAALRGGLTARETAALTCASAFGLIKAGRATAALEALGRATREGGCALRAPYDKLGLELWTAYASYREGGSPAKREAAARVFQKLQPRAPAQLADDLRDLIRSTWEYQGVELYARGDSKRAEAALRTAERMAGRGERRELDHNLAVLDLDAGRTGDAARAFEQLGNRPAEALVNLGIVRDREGDSRRALELYKRGYERGARTPHLREWIDVKERVFSRAAATGGGK